jgi:putative spermidine/putrescine transport system substrate-binding protein
VIRKAIAALSFLALAHAAHATDLTVVSFGGDNKNAQAKAFYEPFMKSTGINVVASEYNGEMAKVKAMVDTRSVSWDVVEVEAPELARGCSDGQFERLDYSKIVNGSDVIAGGVKPCGVGIFVWSTVLAYNADKIKQAPTSWADFWDVKKYPGKRALRKGAKFTLEIALLADGVAPNNVYKVLSTPEGVTRAFRKLDQIKPSIQWWEAGAQPAQYLASGDVVMSSAYNGRVTKAQSEGQNLQIVWNNNLYALDYWAIPRGDAKKDDALKFIAFATNPANQKTFAQTIPYGPASKQAVTLLGTANAKDLPTAPKNLSTAVAIDADFWTDYGENLEQQFNAWAAK